MTLAEREQAASHTTRIWTPLTSFVGRANDAAELIRLLEDSRLITVTGPGGVGRTRLAAELARRVQDRFPDGVWLAGKDLLAAARHRSLTAVADWSYQLLAEPEQRAF